VSESSDTSDRLDLNDAAADIVGSMVPWSLARKKAIASHGENKSVVINRAGCDGR